MPTTLLDRRQFLYQTLASGFALSTAPLLAIPDKPSASGSGAGIPVLDPDMHDARLRQQWRMHELTEGWRRAATSGRPLLIIVVPQDAMRQQAIGGAWGEVLTAGGDEVIAALVDFELVTATQEEIHTVLPAYQVTPPEEEPLLVRIEAAELPARYEAFYTEVFFPGPEDWEAYRQKSWEEEKDLQSAWISKRIASLEALLVSATRVESARRRAITAEQVQARRGAPIPGARWGWNGSCGSPHMEPDPLEGPPPEDLAIMMVMCGMGFVDQRSARFLDFLTGDPQNPVEDYLQKQHGKSGK